MQGAERHTKILTNVWAHQVFKCLAYVDIMRVMNTKILADTQRKLLIIKLFTSIRKESIYPKTIRDWNNLPAQVTATESLDFYKKLLLTYKL